MVLLTITACRTQKTIEIQRTADTVFVHHIDTIREIKTDTKIIYDYNKDSISEKSYNRNDTVFTDRYFYNTQIKYIYKDSSDSIKKQHSDSTYQSKKDNQIIVKEQRKSILENLKNNLKDIVIYLLFLLGCIIVLKNTKIKDKI